MRQKIAGFHQDENAHWVADLACGHRQHVRHDPPWQERNWVISPEGRNSRLGVELDCVLCDEAGMAVAKEMLSQCREALRNAYEEGGLSGLCQEGRFELAVDSLGSLPLEKIIEKSLKK